MSCATLDSGDKNMSLYEGMADLYKDMMDYNMIDVIDQLQMIGFGVDDDTAIDFDQLNPLEFKECLEFILAHYWEARNNKNKSGNHQPFVDYTSGKPYLLYLHLWSTEIGHKAFSDCVYSTLPSETSFSSSTCWKPSSLLSNVHFRNTTKNCSTSSFALNFVYLYF